MTRRVAVAAILAACSLSIIRASTPSAQAGGTIAGVVVSTDQPPQPVRRALVTLTGGALATNLGAVTDDEGRFAFVDLAAGRYSLSVNKAGYLRMAYGATGPGRPGTPIALAGNQRLDVRVPLPKGAVIAGTIRDQSGQPIPAAQVSVSPADTASGLSGVVFSAEAILTDDQGMYRAFGLMPGEYLVSVVPSSVSGEIRQVTAAEYDAKVRALEQRIGGPGAPAPLPVAVAQSPASTSTAPPASGTPLGFAPTYYPGTPVSADAERVRVAAGEERTGVDIALVPVAVVRVSGIIQNAAVSATRITPSLNVIGPPLPPSARPLLSGPRADGSFTFSNVPPGRYMLLARTGQGTMMRMADGRGSTSNNPDVAPTFAMQELVVNGRDIDGVVLAMRPAVTISGTIAFDSTTLKAPENLTSVQVGLVAIGPSLTTATGPGLSLPGMGADRPPNARATAAGTFELTGALPGTYRLSATGPSGWWARSALANGRDLLDDGFDITATSPDVAGMVITFSDRHSGIQGTLTTAPGQPAPEFTVIVFPVEREFWKPGARRVKTTRPSSDGSFSIADLPAGGYFIAALTDVEPNEWQRASFLEQLVASAAKVTVADGQQTRQDLRIVK